MKAKTSLDSLLDQPIDLKALIAGLDFSEENIVIANREQPSLFLEASRYRVKKLRARIQAESLLESERARAAMVYRKKKATSGGITEAYIREKVSVNAEALDAREHLDRAMVHEEWAKLLLEAYRQRGHAIKTLAEILGAEANAQARLARKDLETEGFEKIKQAVRSKYSKRGLLGNRRGDS